MYESEESMAAAEIAERLLFTMREIGPCAVAFSGGVDSAVVARAAQETFPGESVAVTAVTDPPTNPCSTSNVVSPHTKLSSARAGMIIRAKSQVPIASIFLRIICPLFLQRSLLCQQSKPIPASEYRQFGQWPFLIYQW